MFVLAGGEGIVVKPTMIFFFSAVKMVITCT